MKIAVIGSRSFQDLDLLEKYITEKIDISSIRSIISGGAIGTDQLAEMFAEKYNIPIDIIYPEWDKYGKRAGIIRNIEIVKKSDLIFAFWFIRNSTSRSG